MEPPAVISYEQLDEVLERLGPVLAAVRQEHSAGRLVAHVQLTHRVMQFGPNQIPVAGLKWLAAAEDCLGHTHGSGEGPLIDEASLVAARAEGDELVGANLITIPPQDAGEYVAGGPHLTWIFVSPMYARQGVGMALLEAAVQALLRLGYAKLVSTFLLGNESSTLWHWRAGFKLLEQPWSMRAIPKGSAS